MPTGGSKAGDDVPRDEAVRDGKPPRSRPLFPLIAIVIALVIGVLVFIATRSGPNYTEETFTPDEVQEAD